MPPQLPPTERTHPSPVFAAIDELRADLRAPAVDRVLLDEDFNAAVAQVPRLGIFGFHRNYLLVGLPLLQALSPEQFRAVLAHELGHLSNADGHLGAWIYRMRGTWEQLLVRLLVQDHWGKYIFVPFFRWYSPFFSRYSFALARAQEYQADHLSATAAGSRQAADMLITLGIQGEYLQRHYWPELFERIKHQAHPPQPFVALLGALRVSAASATADDRLSEALRRETDPADTHPALRDRLAALGEEPRIPPTHVESAAEWAFGERYAQIVAEMDRTWQGEVGATWDKHHLEATQAITDLGSLDRRAVFSDLTPEETLRRAVLTENVGDATLALERFREALDRNPASPDAQFGVGRLLLEAGDEAGIPLIDRAMDGDWEYTQAGCHLVTEYLVARDREAEAEPYRQQALALQEKLRLANAERQALSRDDHFLPHEMPEAEVAAIAGHLATFPHVEKAYLVRKAVEHFAEKPVYVLGIVIKQPWYLHRSAKTDEKMAYAIARAIEHPEVFYVVPINLGNDWLRKPIQAVPESLIYQRG